MAGELDAGQMEADVLEAAGGDSYAGIGAGAGTGVADTSEFDGSGGGVAAGALTDGPVKEMIDLGLDSDGDSDSTWNSDAVPDTSATQTPTDSSGGTGVGMAMPAPAYPTVGATSAAVHQPQPAVGTQNRSSRRALLIALSYNSTDLQLDGTLDDQNKMNSILLQTGFSRSDIGLLNETSAFWTVSALG